MKKLIQKSKSFLGTLALGVGLVAGVGYLMLQAGALFAPTTVHAAPFTVPTQSLPDNSFTNLAGVPSQITTAVASNINTAIRVQQGKALQVALNFAANNSTTDPLILWWQPSIDGTNYLTTPVNTVSAAANGTTQVIGGGTIAATTLSGYRTIKFTVLSNATARTIFPTNVTVGWSNK